MQRIFKNHNNKITGISGAFCICQHHLLRALHMQFHFSLTELLWRKYWHCPHCQMRKQKHREDIALPEATDVVRHHGLCRRLCSSAFLLAYVGYNAFNTCNDPSTFPRTLRVLTLMHTAIANERHTISIPFYRWRNQDLERLREITQLCARVGFGPRQPELRGQNLNHFTIPYLMQ